MARTREIVGIQYLRGYAALIVVFAHANGMLAFPKYFLYALFPAGTIGIAGVYLFFVISGFIIAYIALEENTLSAKLGIVEFLWRRFARVVPFLWVCVIGFILLRLLGRGSAAWTEHWDAYWRALVMWPTGAVEPGQVWTLRHEALFYLLFSLGLMAGRWRFLPLLLWLLSPLLYWPRFATWDGASLEAPRTLANFVSSPVNVLFGFGLLCGVAYLRRPNLFALPMPAGSLSLGILAVLFAATSTSIVIGYGIVFSSVLASGGLAVTLLYAGICVGPSRFKAADKFAKLLGDASYSIYLTHGGIIAGFYAVCAKLAPSISPLAALAGAVALSVAVGILIHRHVESPLVRAFQRLNTGSTSIRMAG